MKNQPRQKIILTKIIVKLLKNLLNLEGKVANVKIVGKKLINSRPLIAYIHLNL